MSEPIFFKRSPGLTIGEIVALTGVEAPGGINLGHRITGIAQLDRAGPADLTFIDQAKFAAELAQTQAGACLGTPKLAAQIPSHVIALRCADPYGAFVAVTRSLFADSLQPSTLFEGSGIAPGALVHPSARIEAGVTIDPAAVIGARAEIGAGTVIAAGAMIGPGVRIGRNCVIGAGASISHSLLGDRVIIHAGTGIGGDGFSYRAGERGHEKVPQLGRVIIQDDVEIGTNSTIDRGGIGDTVVGEGSKIDNLVHIGHNVTIGRHCLLAEQVGISGSVTIGDSASIGGRVGIADHRTIGEGVTLAAGSSVVDDVPAGERWGSYPARPVRE